jgi:hypothetical protein
MEQPASRAGLCDALQTDDLEAFLEKPGADETSCVRLGGPQIEALSRFIDLDVDLASVLAPPDMNTITEYAGIMADDLLDAGFELVDYVDAFRRLYCSHWSDEQFYSMLHAAWCTLEAHAWERIDAAKAKLPGLREPEMSEAERALDLCDALLRYEAAILIGSSSVFVHPPAEDQ